MVPRIRKIKYLNHHRLGNLELNFCDKSGKTMDTIIIAGENGTCKSTILESLYNLVCGKINYEADIEIEVDKKIENLSYRYGDPINKSSMMCRDTNGNNHYLNFSNYKDRYVFPSVYSDVDINFKSNNISSVTSLTLDSKTDSKRSDNSLPNLIKQLIVDIQAQDDSDLSSMHRKAILNGDDANQIVFEERMDRFRKAFDKMFENIQYDRVDNVDGHKEIYFKKNGTDISIDALSSGEKQIVFRGCFLLKDRDAMNGAFVFIDEPEISLHPRWQQKILDYYKDIYTDRNSIQTSQIFVVTHSPFIIHNENRKNDKVIVVKRNLDGEIIVDDKPEYYKCNSIEAVESAFNIQAFQKNVNNDISTVYLEGPTDEKYFKRAVEVFAFGSIPFEFKWVGYVDDKGKDCNTGKSSLDKAFQFLVSQNLSFRNVCLYDCDTNKETVEYNNVLSTTIPYYNNSKNIKKGIENALILDEIDVEKFRTQRKEMDDYGGEKIIPELDKMGLCDYICSLGDDVLQKVFENLRAQIEFLLDKM